MEYDFVLEKTKFVNPGEAMQDTQVHIEMPYNQKYKPTEQVTKQIEQSFVYHSPKEDQPERYVQLRQEAKYLAEMIVALCPPSRETALAITNLEQSIMWANKSIACNE